MKISQIIFTALFVGAAQADHAKLRALVDTDPVAVLESAECEPLLRVFNDAVEELMVNKESNVEAFLCNPYQRKQTKKTEKNMIKDIERRGDEGVNPCQLAGEKLLMTHSEDVTAALKTTKACKAEVAKEKADFEVQGRALLENGHRKLVLPLVPLIGLAGAAIAAGGGLATAAVTTGGALGVESMKKKRRRNRKLEASLDYESIEEVAQTCKNEDYSLSMYVENETSDGSPHINMVATPSDSNKDGCKDAVSFDDYNAGKRLISYVEDVSFTFADDWQKKSLPLGAFTLGEMKAAADSAEVVMPFKYDMITNNCATFVIEMMGFLKIPIDHKVKEYVVNSLVTSQSLLQDVMGTTEVVLAPDGLPTAEHKEAMWTFVSEYIKDNQK